jgi:hypothetical protein
VKCPSCGGEGSFRVNPMQAHSAQRTGHQARGLMQGGHPVVAVLLLVCKAIEFFTEKRYRCQRCGKSF